MCSITVNKTKTKIYTLLALKSILYRYKMQKVIILYTKNTVTMKNFMDENFLLQTETAQKLYHEHAAKMPIIDYHCHLIPKW